MGSSLLWTATGALPFFGIQSSRATLGRLIDQCSPTWTVCHGDRRGWACAERETAGFMRSEIYIFRQYDDVGCWEDGVELPVSYRKWHVCINYTFGIRTDDSWAINGLMCWKKRDEKNIYNNLPAKYISPQKFVQVCVVCVEAKRKNIRLRYLRHSKLLFVFKSNMSRVMRWWRKRAALPTFREWQLNNGERTSIFMQFCFAVRGVLASCLDHWRLL